MHELDTSDEEMPPNVRHRRDTPGPLRWVVLRMGAGVGALLVVAALAVLTASWAGLTGAPPSATQRIQLPTPAVVPAGPTFGRTLDLDATRADRAAQQSASETPEAVAESASPAATGEPAPTRAPEAAPTPSPAPASVPVVQPGDPCSTEGARGITSAGKPVTCAAVVGDGRPGGARPDGGSSAAADAWCAQARASSAPRDSTVTSSVPRRTTRSSPLASPCQPRPQPLDETTTASSVVRKPRS